MEHEQDKTRTDDAADRKKSKRHPLWPWIIDGGIAAIVIVGIGVASLRSSWDLETDVLAILQILQGEVRHRDAAPIADSGANALASGAPARLLDQPLAAASNLDARRILQEAINRNKLRLYDDASLNLFENAYGALTSSDRIQIDVNALRLARSSRSNEQYEQAAAYFMEAFRNLALGGHV